MQQQAHQEDFFVLSLQRIAFIAIVSKDLFLAKRVQRSEKHAHTPPPRYSPAWALKEVLRKGGFKGGIRIYARGKSGSEIKH